jgi:hypothetical protein
VIRQNGEKVEKLLLSSHQKAVEVRRATWRHECTSSPTR